MTVCSVRSAWSAPIRASDRLAVLRRRLDFLTQSSSFFYDGDTPLRVADVADPYRRGILVTARATRAAEIAWLREQLDAVAVTTLAERDDA